MAAVASKSKALNLYLATEGLVVGQDTARMEMAALLERQWLVHRGEYERSGGAILSGRSGTGKSYTARLMCQHLGLPFAEVDATRYTEQGYKGLDLQQMFVPLMVEAAKMIDEENPLRASRLNPRADSEPIFRVAQDRRLTLDERPAEHSHETSVLQREDVDAVVERAQTGVILLDEFDKWMLRKNHVTGEPDRAIQSELLKMIEGSVEYVRDSDEEIGQQFDTSRVLIICAGAFVGLFQQVARRMGLDADEQTYMLQENFWSQIIPEDFERFGLLPELAGRLSTHIFTRPLTVGGMRDILCREGGLLSEYRARYEGMGCEWGVTEGAVIRMSQMAMERNTGARALEHVCWKMLGGIPLFQASVAEHACQVVLEAQMPKAEVRAL